MPIYDLFGDTSGLPFTTRSAARNLANPSEPLLRYEIEALTALETWGAGNGNSTLVCKQKWDTTDSWIRDMVGEVQVTRPGSAYLLRRYVPEIVQYGDDRLQFCTIVDQVSQGGNPESLPPPPIMAVPDPLKNFSQAVSFWPRTLWCKYKTVFESMPYEVLDDTQVSEIQGAAGAYAGATELYRYCARTRKSYTKEQSTPGGSATGTNPGFYVVDDAMPANRKLVPGGVVFRNIQFADITITWVRVPIGWPPPAGYDADPRDGAVIVWPPLVNPVVADIAKQRTRDTLQGRVNSDWFDCASPDGLCCPPETLLYSGYDDSKKYKDAAGDWVCDVVFSFRYKGGADADGNVRGWNHYMSSSGVWVPVTTDTVPGDGTRGTTAGKRPYKTADMNNLFQYTA